MKLTTDFIGRFLIEKNPLICHIAVMARQNLDHVNNSIHANGACCCPGFVDQDATIGWLTLIANLGGLLTILRLGCMI
ncbi:MAG: hypothetical protein ACYCT2_00125 [Thermoplasmataceae archaeon]